MLTKSLGWYLKHIQRLRFSGSDGPGGHEGQEDRSIEKGTQQPGERRLTGIGQEGAEWPRSASECKRKRSSHGVSEWIIGYAGAEKSGGRRVVARLPKARRNRVG